ncbi:hypothetical protein EMIHUDRAFT_217961 [Emiliania huxleyi CCMP1516]|uniref:Uncharacterized protein n=2 Tax=Emiliania huxleyi TaxID=2903 RepID=A0A0D3I9L6_EMIH1|nr:hypothetical protein EMIHUDRAFT_217961 [Emiliania huxleyi CCMP1516]EOD07951.1 hypothetical protein EMIHUDRAFT_217961 [Emiliania huxleyi CCMP1516]|eukprot:XP_005760380.1 hypothetical protein EMIHUDRAFT_217961 [Emiliania huxleyi CCMP1516]
MLNFKSAGVQDGTFDQAAASGQPPRPPGIPEHYIFDTEVELWMPPSAIAKARSRCVPLPAALLLLHRLHRARPLDGDQLCFDSTRPRLSFTSSFTGRVGRPPGHQLCFDFINRGACARLQRGETCAGSTPRLMSNLKSDACAKK